MRVQLRLLLLLLRLFHVLIVLVLAQPLIRNASDHSIIVHVSTRAITAATIIFLLELCLLLELALALCLLLGRCGALCLLLGVLMHHGIVIGFVRFHEQLITKLIVHQGFGLESQGIGVSRLDFALIPCFNQLAQESFAFCRRLTLLQVFSERLDERFICGLLLLLVALRLDHGVHLIGVWRLRLRQMFFL